MAPTKQSNRLGDRSSLFERKNNTLLRKRGKVWSRYTVQCSHRGRRNKRRISSCDFPLCEFPFVFRAQRRPNNEPQIVQNLKNPSGKWLLSINRGRASKAAFWPGRD